MKMDLLSSEFVEETDISQFIESPVSGGSSAWYKIGSSKPVVVNQNESYAPKILPEKVNTCSLISKGVIDGVCSSDSTVAKISKSIGIDTADRKKIMNAAKHKTKCKDEKCVLRSGIVDADTANKEILINMKLKGPTDTSLLNNFNIDNTLKQWQAKFTDFFPYNFNMRDYERKGDTLATVNLAELYKQGFRTAACVINSDYYKGPGKHWMALFADMRTPGKFTVEFFNSSGNPPYAEFASWLDKSKTQLSEISATEIILCCDLPHQKTKTECGLYSLYYIWARLNGVPTEFFKKYIISDILMIGLRQHLFDGTSNKSGVTGKEGQGPLGVGDDGKFDIEKYKEKSKIPWENDVDADTISKSTGVTDAIKGGWLNENEIKTVVKLRPNYADIGCKLGEDISDVTKKLIEAGLLNKYFIYGNLINDNEVEIKKSTNGGSDDFHLEINHTNEHRLKYRRRKKEPKLSHYADVRGALLEVMEFIMLTNCARVVYVGCAPGIHVKYLAKIFPAVTFILYDTRKFCEGLPDNVEVNDINFTVADAKSFVGSDTYFISDICDDRSNIDAEMKDQMKWFKAGKFKAGWLKFRTPYASTELFPYLSGKLYRCIFPHQTSSLSRLLVTSDEMKNYDCKIYEEEQFYHNTIRRIWGYFEHNVIGEGIDHCYDCRAEIELLSKYCLASGDRSDSSDSTTRKISTMSREISEICGSLIHPPHGVCKNIKMEEKFGHLVAKYGDIATGKKIH